MALVDSMVLGEDALHREAQAALDLKNTLVSLPQSFIQSVNVLKEINQLTNILNVNSANISKQDR